MAAALAAVAILTGCAQNDDEPTPQAPEPILISANSSSTRASQPLEDLYQDFGVWAWKTNPDSTTSLVIGRQPAPNPLSEYYVRYLDTEPAAWTYEYSDASVTQFIKYWDRAALDYCFSAYAPYSADSKPLNSSHTISATPAGVSISAVTANIPVSTGIDWLEARWQRRMTPTLIDIDLISDTDHSTDNFSDIVQLNFHHILAVIEFRIYLEVDREMTLRSLSISLDDAEAIYTEADYAEGSWTYRYDSKSESIFSLSSDLVLSHTSKEQYCTLTSLLQLPQTVTGRTVHVSTEDSYGVVRQGSFTLPEGWESETKYIYYLCLKDDEIILIDVSAEPWQEGEDIQIIDPVVNW